MKVKHNSSFVHQPQGIMVEWVKTNKQAECEFATEKVSQGWKKYVAKCQRDSLLFRVFGWAQEWFRSFCLAWPGTDHSPAPDTIAHTVRERERGREMSGWGGVGEVWCLSLPWSPMALLTIQHPPNYPPIHSQRDKASVLVCWSNMATNLSHSNITPTSLSLEVRRAPALRRDPVYFYLWTTSQNLLREFIFFFKVTTMSLRHFVDFGGPCGQKW